MDFSHESKAPERFRLPLAMKLAGALLAVAVVMLGFLFAYFGPHTNESFIEGSDGIIDLSRGAMEEQVQTNTAESAALLIDIIRHTTDSRRRLLADLPLDLYGGDIDRIRHAIQEADERKSGRLEKNVEILAAEMESRDLQAVRRSLDNLGRAQIEKGRLFAGELRTSYLILAGSVLMLLVLLLGFGLYHAVVHPLQRLRKATQAVTRGDLGINLPGVHSGDEVGGLFSDFSAMVKQLRESRADIRLKNDQLKELNRNLESEVARKTRHLEQALTDLRTAQKQLIHAEKMASIGTLARGVAHEFNNLMGGIRGCTAEAIESERDAGHRELLEVILRAADRAADITSKLLRFSKQEALRLADVDIRKVLDDALLLIEPDARKRNVCIERRIDELPRIKADGNALHQVMLNLYTNALQAMPGGGRLVVEAEECDGSLLIRVEDTGMGIPSDQIDHIFEPFFTTKAQESDPFERGTGLGLSVSYALVDAHGGRLEMRSRENEGSVFTVVLPLATKAPGGADGEDE